LSFGVPAAAPSFPVSSSPEFIANRNTERLTSSQAQIAAFNQILDELQKTHNELETDHHAGVSGIPVLSR